MRERVTGRSRSAIAVTTKTTLGTLRSTRVGTRRVSLVLITAVSPARVVPYITYKIRRQLKTRGTAYFSLGNTYAKSLLTLGATRTCLTRKVCEGTLIVNTRGLSNLAS